MTHRLSCALQIPPMWLGCTQTCCRQTTANSCTIRTLCPPCPGQSWRRLIWLLLITSPRCVYMPKMSFATLRKLEKPYLKWGSTKRRTETQRLFQIRTCGLKLLVFFIFPHRNAATLWNSWTTPTLPQHLRSWRERLLLEAAKNSCRSSTPPCSNVTCM